MKIMQRILLSLICALALLAFLMPATIAQNSQNAAANLTMNWTQNLTGNLTLNATDNVTASVIPVEILNASSHTKVLRAGFEKAKAPNNLDVYGNKSTYSINASYKPLYNVSQYSRTKPLYEVPDTLSSKPVYSISGYPEIKAVNSIP
jgi:hypothetical protein